MFKVAEGWLLLGSCGEMERLRFGGVRFIWNERKGKFIWSLDYCVIFIEEFICVCIFYGEYVFYYVFYLEVFRFCVYSD